MPLIKVTDTVDADVKVVAVHPNPLTAALDKYVVSPAITLVLLPDLIGILKEPLLHAGQQTLSLGLKFKDKLALGTGGTPKLMIGAGVGQRVTVNAKAGSALLPADLFGSAVAVRTGEGWLSLALTGTVDLGFASQSGNLTFGIKSGAGFIAEYFRRFEADPHTPTVGEALGELLSDFILPADIADLAAMQDGNICTVSGTGTLKIAGDLDVSISANPLASPSLPLVNQAVMLEASATVKAGVSLEISGAYQIRIRRLPGERVELGYYRKKAEEWSVSVSASAGLAVEVGKTDYLAKVIGRLTGQPEADVALLLEAGLSQSQIERLQAEISRSIDHSVAASVDMELFSSGSDEAAFLYQIKLNALDDSSAAAVQSALGGDLTLLTRLDAGDGGDGVIAAGITRLRSVLRNVRDRKSSFKLNLVGLLNFSSVVELLQNSEVFFEPVSGDLTVNQTVEGSSIGVLTTPASQQKLRRIRFDSLLVTSAYRASRSVSAMAVTSSDVHFAFNQNTNAQTISGYLNGLIALGLMDARSKPQTVNAFQETGPSTFLLRVELGDTACEAMFLDQEGRPRPPAEYEQIGREAMGDLLVPGDEVDRDRYRRDVLLNADLWARLTEAGLPNFGQILPVLARNSVRLEVVKSDYAVVMWWAESMASTAKQLVAVRAFVRSADPATLHESEQFQTLRNGLQRHVAVAVAKSGMRFDLPFGLVALYRAALPLATADGLILSGALRKRFTPVMAVRGVGALPSS